MTSPGLVIKSPAKVNLGLAVGPRRPDGFHEIVTVMALLELHDTIHIRLTKAGIGLSSTNPDLPAGPDNLGYKAAAALLNATGSVHGCRVRIAKRIPVGAGLGGGSSNAAAVLFGLNQLLGSRLNRHQLHRLGQTIGSDVPVFLAWLVQPTRTAFVARGRGERLRPLSLPQLQLCLYFPGYPIPTGWAYRELDRLRARRRLTPFRSSPKILAALLRRNELDKAAAWLGNDFEPVVFARHPDLAQAKRLLLENCAAAALSGSGSTVYGLVRSHERQDLMAALKRLGFPAILTKTLGPPARK